MLVEELEQVLDTLAPFATAEPWDNVGLLVGRRGVEVRKVLVALDLTEDVVVEAVTGGYQAVITHHPLLFSPIKSVTDRNRVGVLVTQLIAADIVLFALHTNLDGARGPLRAGGPGVGSNRSGACGARAHRLEEVGGLCPA